MFGQTRISVETLHMMGGQRIKELAKERLVTSVGMLWADWHGVESLRYINRGIGIFGLHCYTDKSVT